MDNKHSIQILDQGNVAVVEFLATSMSDMETITDSSKVLKAFIDSRQPAKLVFDFSHVRCCSSLVLGLLLETRSRMRNWEGRMTLCGMNAKLYRVFRITNLDTLFQLVPDREKAVERLNA